MVQVDVAFHNSHGTAVFGGHEPCSRPFPSVPKVFLPDNKLAAIHDRDTFAHGNTLRKALIHAPSRSRMLAGLLAAGFQ